MADAIRPDASRSSSVRRRRPSFVLFFVSRSESRALLDAFHASMVDWKKRVVLFFFFKYLRALSLLLRRRFLYRLLPGFFFFYRVSLSIGRRISPMLPGFTGFRLTWVMDDVFWWSWWSWTGFFLFGSFGFSNQFATCLRLRWCLPKWGDTLGWRRQQKYLLVLLFLAFLAFFF